MSPAIHPVWCDTIRCTAAGDGMHESEPVRVAMRGKADPPRMLLLLTAPTTGSPIRLRMVVIGDLLVNSLDLDLDTAHLAANSIHVLLEKARPPETHAGEGWPTGNRH